MVTEISLNTICGHTTQVTATKEGKNTHIHIDTDCEKLQKWGTDFELELKDLMGTPGNTLAQKTEKASLTPTCLVPAAVMNACWLENSLISKNLARKMGKMEIVFEKL